MALMQLRNVGKTYSSRHSDVDVLDDINLDLEDGEFVAIVGFSGSGKTTLISLMAGLEAPSSGEILFEGAPIRGPGSERGVVFQSYSLMPWFTVEGNIALGVDSVLTGSSRRERREIVARYIEMVGLSHAVDRRPAELSGGMRQRVAVARALATSPRMLLLDEPLSALDALTRGNLQREIERIWSAEKKTIVLITNDVDEAILLADRIIPLKPGPGATLGPEFRVGIPRPRDPKAMNKNAEFRRLRGAVTRYLLEVGHETAGADEPVAAAPPAVLPLDVSGPPRAYLKAAQSPPVNHYVEFFKVTKIYPTPKGPLTVVDEFDLRMEQGEFVSLIGHSGCGKSTVLSMAAGLNDVTGGGIVLDGREVVAAGPDRAVVFQAPSLFPWLTAEENVALGVDRVYPHASRTERADIVAYYLARVGLAAHSAKPARDLSNGMKQRVGIARAFALNPKLLLLDEPFGMLDSLTRWELQELLMEVWARTQVTAICVTHDVDEAILLADRVVMMTNGPHARVGKIMEVDLPRPRTRQALLSHRGYYRYRQELLDFLEGAEREESATGMVKAKAKAAWVKAWLGYRGTHLG
jgi:nitrate/nitrite transport system ATP-binding protein